MCPFQLESWAGFWVKIGADILCDILWNCPTDRGLILRPALPARPPPHDPAGHPAVPQHPQDVHVDPARADQRHVRLHVAHGRGHHPLGKRTARASHAERGEVFARVDSSGVDSSDVRDQLIVTLLAGFGENWATLATKLLFGTTQKLLLYLNGMTVLYAGLGVLEIKDGIHAKTSRPTSSTRIRRQMN